MTSNQSLRNTAYSRGISQLFFSFVGIFLLVCASWAADRFERRDVKFKSQGLNLAGWLYVPKGNAEKRPAVVMANGYSLPKEAYMDVFAEPLAAAGFVVLVFDYRFLGASEGEPRQQIFPQAQIEDYRNAITWISLQKEVDASRIGLWGISYSGGHVLHLGAYDKRVKAVASLLPLVDAMQGYWMRTIRQDLLPDLRAKLAADRAERYATGKINYMPVVAPEGQPGGIPGKAAYDFFMGVPKIAPNWKNQVTFESVEQGMEYQPGAAIHLISPTPLLMVVATHDATAPTDLALTAYSRALEPKTLIFSKGTHWAGENEQEDAKLVGPVVDWFKQQLSK
jgi:uncharacterized protein